MTQYSAAQLYLVPSPSLFGPSFTYLALSLLLALLLASCSPKMGILSCGSQTQCIYCGALITRKLKWDAAGRNPSFLHTPVLSGGWRHRLLLLFPQAAPLGREMLKGMDLTHGYQAVGKARYGRGWRSSFGRTQTKEPTLNIAAKRQRIRLLRDLANSLEHWDLAGAHPSPHERGSVFSSFKQCMS